MTKAGKNPLPSPDVIEELKKKFPSLSPRMKKLAAHIVEHHKEAAFLNAADLAAQAGVSEATVTRLTHLFNFKGYQEFRRALQDRARHFLSLPRHELKPGEGGLLEKVATMETGIINAMVNSISQDDFEKAVDMLTRAAQITVLGFHYNSMPASYAAYFLGAFGCQVRLVDKLDMELFQNLFEPKLPSTVLAIHTARYPQPVLKLLPLLRQRGASIILITDSPVAPALPFSDLALLVPMKFSSFIDPYGAVMTLIQALVTGVFLKGGETAKKRLKDFNVIMAAMDYNYVDNGEDITELL